MKKEYLLKGGTAQELYESVKNLPIIDYHNHLSVCDISENKIFDNIYDLWIEPDPYKHRAMRMCGIPERYITSNIPKIDKFKAWCSVYPKLIGNPLYVWSKSELESVFGIYASPDEYNAEKIYKTANDYLKNNIVTPKALMNKFNVEFACPCISITDDISVFGADSRIAPSLRGDDITAPNLDFIARLESITEKIGCLSDYKQAVVSRLDKITEVGCKFSDHAIDCGFKYYDDDGNNEKRFGKIINGENMSNEDKNRLFSHLAVFVFGEYAKRDMVLQLHIGAQRYTSTRLRKIAGANGGFACIGNSVDVLSLTAMLDRTEQESSGLPRMVLFTLNPADSALISAISGSYTRDGISGLVTQGPAWWWCDHKEGIINTLENISSYGLLSNFIGMTTDSRSFLSFARHDYFRRVLCEWAGKKHENKELCCDFDSLARLIRLLCYENAKRIIEQITENNRIGE